MVFGKDTHTEKDSEAARVAAVILIQRLWRGRTNKAKDEHMTSEARWEDAANSARLEVSRSRPPFMDSLFALTIHR